MFDRSDVRTGWRNFIAWPMLAAAILLLTSAGLILTNTAEDDRSLAGLAELMAGLGAVLIGAWIAMLAAGIGGSTVDGQKKKKNTQTDDDLGD